ncbi:ankyrin repeat domain-containing protein [Dactylosporangium sp. CA-092794]|uniref:ankyrin repeat domain-containing protein n=1 Tax=Dactylosporangium sp. CA-092794 TaxID=3239929 RepID=UPI003D92BD94
MEDAGSIPAGLPFLARDLPQWRRIRAEMPSPSVVAAAAEARAAGDWRAAATLMPVDVVVDPPAVRARFGAAAADALEDDLRHLCLDLLWWHLPRHRGGMTTLQAQVSAILAPRTGADTAPLLRLRLPRSPTGPQRVRLEVASLADLQYDRWYLAPRHTWDVRETAELANVWQDSQVYSLLSAGDHASAWRRCGIAVDSIDPEALQRPTTAPTSPLGVAEQARAAAAAFGVDEVATLFGAYLRLNVSDLTATGSDPSEWMEVPVRIPTGTIPPDLALIEAGLMSPSRLHPLMREALYPDAPSFAENAGFVGYPGSFRVRCGADWHRLAIEGGALRLPDHDEAEQLREAALRSLGGSSSGCYAAQQAWTTGGRLPRALAAHRREVLHRLQHGDTEYLMEGLGNGSIDPRMRAGNGWSLVHMAMWVDHARALPALLAAGVPVDARDRIGRTPLYTCVMNGADPELVRALLAAGADPHAETVHGADPAGVARARGDWRDLRFLGDLVSGG